MPEWSIGTVSKTVEPFTGLPGFESLPLRHSGRSDDLDALLLILLDAVLQLADGDAERLRSDGAIAVARLQSLEDRVALDVFEAANVSRGRCRRSWILHSLLLEIEDADDLAVPADRDALTGFHLRSGHSNFMIVL